MGRNQKHNPSFFKVLIGDFANQLRIPPDFVPNWVDQVPETVVIRDQTGDVSWAVELERIGENYWFMHDGWKQFVSDCELKSADFVIFKLISEAEFEFRSYGPNGCLKTATLITGSIVKFEPSEDLHDCPSGSRVLRPRKPRSYGDAKRRRRRRRRVESGSSETPANPWFSTVITRHHIYRLGVGIRFARETRMTTKKGVVLRNEEGKVWPVGVSVGSNHVVLLTTGWSDFRKANRVGIGNVCIFEYVRESGGCVIQVKVEKKGRWPMGRGGS